MRGKMKLESVNGVAMNSNQKKRIRIFARFLVQSPIVHKDKKKERSKSICRKSLRISDFMLG